MKKIMIFSSAVLLTGLIATGFRLTINPELEIGSSMPDADHKMMDVSGKEVSLNEVKGTNGTLVIFSCNTCPYVKLSESRIKELGTVTSQNKVGMMVVNSNEAQRSEEDSFDAMKSYAKEQGYTFSYVVDKNSNLANAFGATRTPHCFLFDKNGKLVYRGAIDDNIKEPNDAKEHYLKDAVVAIAAGKTIKTNSTKSVGCSIKRVE
ncbi:MAG: thioredoxin family protein [Bacteroidota bacterium]|nr:thioredoxin family protein [Bacteroidota bacterium]